MWAGGQLWRWAPNAAPPAAAAAAAYNPAGHTAGLVIGILVGLANLWLLWALVANAGASVLPACAGKLPVVGGWLGGACGLLCLLRERARGGRLHGAARGNVTSKKGVGVGARALAKNVRGGAKHTQSAFFFCSGVLSLTSGCLTQSARM